MSTEMRTESPNHHHMIRPSGSQTTTKPAGMKEDDFPVVVVEIVIKQVKEKSFKNADINHGAASKSELTLVSEEMGKTILRQRISDRLSQIFHQRFSMRLPQISCGFRSLSFSRIFEEKSFSSISCDNSTGSDDSTGSDNSTLTVDC